MQAYHKGSVVKLVGGARVEIKYPLTSAHGRIHQFVCYDIETGKTISINTSDMDLSEKDGVWFWEEFNEEV